MRNRSIRSHGSAPPRWLGAFALVGLALSATLPLAGQEGDLEQVLQFHLSRYPKMQPDDLYKLLHQAAMGSEHAIPNREAARQWMNRELEDLRIEGDETVEEPLIEPLSPDGRLVRVNLRPYLRSGADPELLLDAFVLTAGRHQGDSGTLERYCNQAVDLAREGELPFSPAELDSNFAALKTQGYPAVHHSAPYAEAYRPAYRVVLRELLDRDSVPSK